MRPDKPTTKTCTVFDASSPFQAQFVAQKHARQHQSELPLVADTVLESMYKDDSMDSVTDVKTGVGLYSQLSKLWESAGMHGWKCQKFYSPFQL